MVPIKKLNTLSGSTFLKLFFAYISLCLLLCAPILPDRGQMLAGLWRIWSQPARIFTNYFALGGFSATFLNMGLVGLCCVGLLFALRAEADGTTVMGFLLTVGFAPWGIHVLNIWPTVLGVMVYALVKREKPGKLVNAMLFSTGIAPLISELLVRYPGTDVGFSWVGLAVSLFIGFVIGFFLPAGLTHSPKVHKGFDLYSAALPVGMTAFLLQALLYKTMGVSLPQSLAESDPASLLVSSGWTVNLFCVAVFAGCVVMALCMGVRLPDYWRFLTHKERESDVVGKLGNGLFLLNAGVYGLSILVYYNLVGAEFNGITLGIVFCMLATCNAGSHPGNIWPIVVGYGVAAGVMELVSRLTGGDFQCALSSQTIVVGLCYASGLTPISDQYGWRYGMLASGLHYVLVTSVPMMHGGFCLYNGGFTAALICVLLIPVLERFCKTKLERRAARAAKKELTKV